ncbi:TolC family protein [Mariniblastus sp.]|nr:TolC family protein [Mariniblastus sp.]
MSFSPSKILFCSFLVAIVVSGCTPTKPIYFNDVGDLSHYVEQATSVEYPDVAIATLDEVTQSHRPITVMDPDFDSYEDISLEDAVAYSLANSKVVRGYGTPALQSTRVLPGQDSLAVNPGVAATSYDIAIRESEPGFIGQPGQFGNPSSLSTNGGLDVNQGVEAALADFDAQLTSSINYAKSDIPRNSVPSSPLNDPIFQQDQVSWQSEIGKKTAGGTQVFFRNVNQYTANNNPLQGAGGLQVLDSFYQTSFEAEIRQPLLRGRGAFINRMPIVISRIGTDQQIANLESTLQNKVTNIEIRYWELYCAYRRFEAAKTGRKAALETWRIVKDQFDEGSEVNIQQVAQASGQYHLFDSQVIDSFNNLLNVEGQLRYLLGWASTDGRFLRPTDEPVMAPIEFDWESSLAEALTYRPELRQERWEVKKKELALAYSKNSLLPELNVSMVYRWLGLGNQFGVNSSNSQPFPSADSGALNELYGGNFQEVQFGGTFAMPVGYRRELANVRNAQLKLAREIARVEDMELDVTKELSEAMRALAANQMVMQASFNQWKDTTVEEAHFIRLQDAGVETLDVALEAQRRRAQAEDTFYTALCEYNKVIALIHRRKGTILAYSGISFSEGPWPGKAYSDADEHARRRGASRQIDYGWTRPQVISRGEDWPTAENVGGSPKVGVANESRTDGEMQDATGATSFNEATFNEATFNEATLDEVLFENEFPLFEQSEPRYRIPDQGSNAGAQQYGDVSKASSLEAAKKKAQNVKQVGYQEEIPIVQADNWRRELGAIGMKRLRSGDSGEKQPVADKTPRPSKRLVKPASVPLKLNASTDSAANSNRLNWEKFGLDRPKTMSQRSTAKIKLN